MAKFGVKEVADVTFYNLITGKPELYLNTLTLSNIVNAANTVHATGGKGNPRLLSWDTDRTAQFDCQDALLDPKSLSMQSGTTLVTGIQQIAKREVLVVVEGTPTTSNQVSLAKTPTTGTNVYVYQTTDGNDIGLEVTPTTVAGQIVSWTDAGGPAVGTQVVVFYTFDSTNTAQLITVSSSNFPGYYRVVGDTFMRNNTSGQDEPFQIVIKKAKIQPGWTLTMQAQGNPSVFDFKMEVYKPANGTDMIDFIKY